MSEQQPVEMQATDTGYTIDLAFVHARWHRALDDVEAELPGPIRDHIEQHDARILAEQAATIARVEALAGEWESWARTRSTPRIDAFRDAAEHLRAALRSDPDEATS